MAFAGWSWGGVEAKNSIPAEGPVRAEGPSKKQH